MELKVQKRDVFGSKVQSLRVQGFVPGELYGRGIQNVHLSIPVKEFRSAYKEVGENRLLNVIVNGESHPVLVQNVDVHPLTDEFLSVDFYQVRMDEKIHAMVPLRFVGDASAVKNFGGILVKAMNDIKIEALPADIPSDIAVDLSSLAELNQSIYVKDLPQSDKYKFMVDPSNVIVSVSEQEEEAAPVVAPSVEQVVSETEEKKAARDAEKTAAETSGK